MASKNNKDMDQGSLDIELPDAIPGKVVTRFPPEPSGYLHIGHAKAALLNQHFAEKYNGKLIVRFDDTNPSKEKVEFEESIKVDLALIGVDASNCSHTSDYFDQIYELALKLIKEGNAYVDDTDQETMQMQRGSGIPSRCRDLSVEENLKRFDEMTRGTEFGQKCCLRAKISVDDVNKAMRDPVIYRCNLLPHHRTGDKWKVYPTYDFACPIVDSLEGVTHALRTNEYRDRNPQYEWMLEACQLRKPHIWDFSRVNFVYTLLSKRKLQWFVDQGLVSGWDDPRFPTVRGIRRRGLTIEALKKYILMQGASQRIMLLEWDKLWALNKNIINPIAPRHVMAPKDNLVKVKVHGAPEPPQVEDRPKYRNNPDLGNKKVTYSSEILLSQEDAAASKEGETVTLMDWGNAVVKRVVRAEDTGIVATMEMELNLEDKNMKKTRKLTWLADETSIVECTLVDYDYLITKKNLEKNEEVSEFVTPKTEYHTEVIADPNVKHLKRGDIIEFMRTGFFIVDGEWSETTPTVTLVRIPDGSAATMASKHAGEEKEAKKDQGNEKKKGEKGKSKEEKKAEKEAKKAERKAKKEKAKAEKLANNGEENAKDEGEKEAAV
ncbi:uncharacterized protein VTP21DRAFT_6946 [Calcarisporiella thermophila]|uniref:uncharacterized protein n=1 Tax=Calcarisporiella thermophila TaxID=911321 RepID=UPI003742C7B6